MTTHGQVAKSMRETIEALRADVERLERARLRSADWLTFEKMEAEVERLREIMRRLVHGIDEWNASVEPIIGRPVDYKWLALEEARAALAPEVKP